MAVSSFVKTRAMVVSWASRTKPHGQEQWLKQHKQVSSQCWRSEFKLSVYQEVFLSAQSPWPVCGPHHSVLFACDPAPTSFAYKVMPATKYGPPE